MAIDPKTTALLVIDILQGGDEDSIYRGAGEDFARCAAKVTTTCRAAGVPVIFCDDAHIKGIDREISLWGEHGMAGSPEAQPADFLGHAESDLVIPKRRYSGFFQTDLDLTLRELGISTVIAIGCDTNICVLHTLADAYFLGYDSVVVADATFTFLVGTQEQGLEHCERCYGSTIATTDEVVAALGSR